MEEAEGTKIDKIWPNRYINLFMASSLFCSPLQDWEADSQGLFQKLSPRGNLIPAPFTKARQ